MAKFGSPDPLNVDLNSGGLTDGIQLDVPPGPAGAMPNITLAYNSAAVSEQHSPQGAAGWVGEGWSLSLGSISWAEHNVLPRCTTGCNNSWQSSWQLTDPFGTSTELIPPNLATSTYYDESNNWWCTTGNSTSTPCPIQFQTASASYARVYAYVGPIYLGAAPDPLPCFRVYLTNGVMEEFGCTPDSLQYYPILAGTLPGQNYHDVYYPVSWLLDLITNPQGGQVHLTYQSDTETAPDGLTYPRDTVLKTIEWDAPDCANATQACNTSSTWHPHYRVSFSATHQQANVLRTTTTGTCNTDTTVRCDDPTTVSGGIAAPLVNGTFVLNDAYVQTNPSGNGASYNSTTWNTVRDYQFSYEQSGPTTITDPATGKQVSTAGYLDLTQLQEVGDGSGLGAASYPPTVFGYTSQTEYYEDGSYTPYSTTFCGPSWNTGGNGGTCDLWSQSRDGNSRYLATVSNGQGLQTTLSWANARSNTHGVNSPGSPADPLYCNSHQTGYPCNSADDQAWSRMVVTQQSDTVVQLTQAGQGGQQTSTPVTSTSAYTYRLSYPLAAQECTDCVAGMYWGNQNDGDYLDYYNGHFMGFAQTSVSNPDGSVVVHKYEPTQGWGVYDTGLVTSCPSTLPPVPNPFVCHASPWWNVANAGHGLETETDFYDTNGTTLLKKVTAQYSAVCGTALGLSATPTYTVGGSTFGPWDNNLVSELDHNNPVAVCDVQQTQRVTSTFDGMTNTITNTAASSYDNYGRETQATSTSNSGGGSGSGSSPTQIIDKSSYVWNDGLTVPLPQQNTTNQEPAWGGTRLIDTQASTDTEDSGGTQYACQRMSYDGQGYTTGQTNALTRANTTEQDSYATSCGSNPTGKLSHTMTYDAFGNQVSTTDADANNGDASHTGASGTACAGATTCAQYDPTSQAKSTSESNLANQATTSSYTASDQASGYGLWPTSITDPTGGVTTYTYDALGRQTSVRSPGQSTGPATESKAYANWCTGTSAQSPCVEEDTTRRLDSNTTVTTRLFYNGAGRLVETRTAAPGGQDTVRYTLYNSAGEAAIQSVQYFVAAYTGAAGSAAYSIPDSSQAVTTTTYDGLGRTLTTSDALSNVTQTAYSVVCNAPGTSGDTGCYEQTLATDANHHRHGTLTDGFGRQIYDQAYSGNSPSTYALYSTAKYTYDYNGRLTKVQQPNGQTATSAYDTAGRLTSASDPDRGLTSYSYDANGNLTQQIDARCGTSLPQTPCAAGTTYTGYDGLDRPIWRNTGNNASGAYVTYSYDATANGSSGTGRLAAEVFRNPTTGVSGAYTYSYDALGRTTRTDQTMGGAGACPTGWSCADIGGPALAGTQSFAGDGIWTVAGGGSDISGTSDQFHFISQSQTGGRSLTIHVDSLTNTGTYAKVGVMFRDGTAANAAFYYLQVDANGQYYVTQRATAGASATTLASGAVTLPISLRVMRSGNTFSAATSSDGTNWTPIAASVSNLSLSSTLQLGVAVSANNTSAVSLATIDSLTTANDGSNTCPSPSSAWTCQDIGNPPIAGSQSYIGNGQWTVSASGLDIYGTSDQFRFVSTSLSGDGSVSARLISQTNTSGHDKVGVMLRDGSAANAPFYSLLVETTGTYWLRDRTTAGGSAPNLLSGSTSLPVYVKVTRSGNTFTAATSPDGTNWTTIAGSAQTLNLSTTLQAGIAVAAYNTSALTTAQVEQILPSAMPPASFSSTATAAVPPSLPAGTPLAAPAGVTSYPIQQSYNDASMPTATIYPDGETVTTSYTGQGWLSGLTTTQNSTTTTLLGNVTYSGAGGAAMRVTGAQVGNNTYQYSATFDALVRATDTKLTRTSNSAVLFEQSRGYDAMSNVNSVGTTLPAGTDNQAFCYDDQNRLTWASSASGSIPCGGTLTAGSLSSSQYTNTYSFDTLDRLTSGPAGGYTYGDSAHLHAVTAIGSSYTATYDGAGNMTCRAPTSSTTCVGTQTGAQLSWDNEGRLTAWQSQPGSTPTSQTSDLYDGEGNRVEQQVTSGGATTGIVYVGNLEEVSTTGSSTTTTTYYYAGGTHLALAVNGVFSYLGSDGLGSAEVALDSSGNVQASTLYGPYGSVRYSSGSMPGTYAFTGQRADTTTGLDYYNARYYDPVAGQFASADTANDGLNRYGYVGGNPETATDPSGHYHCIDDPCTRGQGPTPTPPHCVGSSCWAPPPSGGHPGNPGSSSCDTTCQDEEQTGWGNIWLGGIGFVLSVGVAAGICFTPFLNAGCALAIKTAIPWAAQGARYVLAGIDLIRQAHGVNPGDVWTVIIRAAMLVLDVITIAMSVYNIVSRWNEIMNAIRFVRGTAEGAREAFTAAGYLRRIAEARAAGKSAGEIGALEGNFTKAKLAASGELMRAGLGLASMFIGATNVWGDFVLLKRSIIDWRATHP